MRILLLALLISTNALANYKDFYFNQQQQKATKVSDFKFPKTEFNNFKSRESLSGISSKTFNQKLTHFDESESRTFKQRYYVNDVHAVNANSPVLLYICGESTCHESSVIRGAIVEYAMKFNATVIALEHRYYGKSQPFTELTTENMRYLSTDEAVEDLAHFQTTISKRLNLNGKWIALGGSYPGNLAAYYRQKYPNLVVGALASSAPVKAKAEFNEYDAHVTKVVGPRCAGLMQDAVAEIENSLTDRVRTQEIKKMFNAGTVEDDVDFLYVVADIGAIAAQYGYIPKFCADLSAGKTALDGYATFGRYILKAWRMTAESISMSSSTSVNPADYESGFGMRQWLYQSCTEYGYWQVAHPTTSTRSSMIDLPYHNNVCEKLFGITTPVNTDHINHNFYEPLLNKSLSSDILFTNGSTDPWMNLSILPEHNSNISNLYFLINGAAHCDDLRGSDSSDSAVLKQSRTMFEDMIKNWL
jgi:pimeloyl-ACP methyl ester carboxylesterase